MLNKQISDICSAYLKLDKLVAEYIKEMARMIALNSTKYTKSGNPTTFCLVMNKGAIEATYLFSDNNFLESSMFDVTVVERNSCLISNTVIEMNGIFNKVYTPHIKYLMSDIFNKYLIEQKIITEEFYKDFCDKFFNYTEDLIVAIVDAGKLNLLSKGSPQTDKLELKDCKLDSVFEGYKVTATVFNKSTGQPISDFSIIIMRDFYYISEILSRINGKYFTSAEMIDLLLKSV